MRTISLPDTLAAFCQNEEIPQSSQAEIRSYPEVENADTFYVVHWYQTFHKERRENLNSFQHL